HRSNPRTLISQLVQSLLPRGRQQHEHPKTHGPNKAECQQGQPVLRPVAKPKVPKFGGWRTQTPDPALQAFTPGRHIANDPHADDQVSKTESGAALNDWHAKCPGLEQHRSRQKVEDYERQISGPLAKGWIQRIMEPADHDLKAKPGQK